VTGILTVTRAVRAQDLADTPKVIFSTTLGNFMIELYPGKAPITVKNFLAYVNAGFFDNTIFHRVIPGFMIQGGGFTEQMQKKPTQPPIKNEAKNGLKNKRGTLSMARTGVVDSATAQFFINLKDNVFLDHGSRLRLRCICQSDCRDGSDRNDRGSAHREQGILPKRAQDPGGYQVSTAQLGPRPVPI